MGFLQKFNELFAGNENPASPFDQIRHQDEEGEYWLSDELAPKVGYKSVRAYHSLRQTIAEVAETYAYGPKELRIDSGTGINSQVSGRGRKKVVYRMSRKFLMSLAHKLDIRKEEVRLLHAYLDIQVRRQEMSDQQRAEARLARTSRTAKKFGHSYGWIPVRVQNKSYNGEIIAHVLDELGGELFAMVFDTIHVEITGKHAPQLRAAMGLKKGTPFDGYDAQCLIIVSSVAVDLLTLFDAGDLNADNVVEETRRLVRLHKTTHLAATRHDAIGRKETKTGHVIYGVIRKSVASS